MLLGDGTETCELPLVTSFREEHYHYSKNIIQKHVEWPENKSIRKVQIRISQRLNLCARLSQEFSYLSRKRCFIEVSKRIKGRNRKAPVEQQRENHANDQQDSFKKLGAFEIFTYGLFKDSGQTREKQMCDKWVYEQLTLLWQKSRLEQSKFPAGRFINEKFSLAGCQNGKAVV